MNDEFNQIANNLKLGNYQTVLDLINSSQINRNHMYIKFTSYLSKVRLEKYSFGLNREQIKAFYRSILADLDHIRPKDNLPKYLIHFLRIEIHLLLGEKDEATSLYKEIEIIEDAYFKRLYKKWGYQLDWSNLHEEMTDVRQLLQEFQKFNERADCSDLLFFLANWRRRKYGPFVDYGLGDVEEFVTDNVGLVWKIGKMESHTINLQTTSAYKYLELLRTKMLDDNVPDFLKCLYYSLSGHIENARGHYRKAIDYFNQCTDLNHKEYFSDHVSAYIALSYYRLGNLDQAFAHLEKPLKYNDSDNDKAINTWVFFVYFLYALKTNDQDLINEAYAKYQTVSSNFHLTNSIIKQVTMVFDQVVEALKLKASDRLSNKMMELGILDQIIDELPFKGGIIPEVYTIAIVNLIELNILELKSSGNPSVFETIKRNLKKLDRFVIESDNKYLRVEYFILAAKIHLLELNFEASMVEMHRAIKVVKENNLTTYEEIIVSEQEELEEEIDNFSRFISSDADSTKVIDLLNLDKTVQNILNYRKSVDKKKIKSYIRTALSVVEENK